MIHHCTCHVKIATIWYSTWIGLIYSCVYAYCTARTCTWFKLWLPKLGCAVAMLGCGVSRLILNADCKRDYKQYRIQQTHRVLFILVLSCNVNTRCMFLTKDRSAWKHFIRLTERKKVGKLSNMQSQNHQFKNFYHVPDICFSHFYH